MEIFDQVKLCAENRVLFLPHAVKQMSKADRMISVSDVKLVISQGKLIEDYPEDSRGHSCLIAGVSSGKMIHVVCSPKVDYLAIITAYIPDKEIWDDSGLFRRDEKS